MGRPTRSGPDDAAANEAFNRGDVTVSLAAINRWRWSILLCLALAALGGAFAFWLAGNARPRPELPVASLRDGVFWVRPDAYAQTLGQLRRSEAVFLPVEPDASSSPVHSESTGFVGSQACVECHAEYVESAAETAHARTLEPATPDVVLGSFEGDQSIVRTRNPQLWFQLEQRGEELFQKLFVERGGQRYVHAERLDLVVGSGKLGQTFLYWHADALYELPITYFTTPDRWTNSPGYIDGTANFARPVGVGCLHCHATWVNHLPDSVNRYDFRGAVLGVTCERCHGPAQSHIEFQHGLSALASDPIVNPATLSRDRQLDVCSQCHSGVGEQLRPPFSYRPGDDLADFLRIPNAGTNGPGGVHSANQRARLSLSRCFQASPEMTCSTCHDPHEHERGRQSQFAARCLNCHGSTDCGIVQQHGSPWDTRCIDCHMLLSEDTQMMMQTADDALFPLLRDHFIRVDRPTSNRVLTE